MSTITDIRCTLTQKALDAFCNTFHFPEEVHLVLPNPNDTMHERPTGKIGLYTKFFDFAKFRLPLSTFLVDILRHFRINISQLFVIGAAKVSHFEILCRVYEIVRIVGLFRCFYVNSKKSGWILFSKRSDNAVIWTSLISSMPRILPNELEASVKRLFDEGDSGTKTEQEDSARGGADADSQPVVGDMNIFTEDAAPRLLAGVMLNAKVRVTAIPTLPFVTASMSTTPEREDEGHADFVAEPNLPEVDSLVRSSTLVMTTATIVTSMVDSTLVAGEKTIKPSMFAADSSSAGGANPNTSFFSDLFGSDFLFGGICTIIDPDTDLQKVYMSLSVEVRMRAEYNVKERKRLKSIERNTILKKKRNALDVKATNLEASAMDKECELTNLNVQLNVVKSQNDILMDQDAQLKIVNDKFDKLYADFVEMALHLEKKFYPHLLTTISDHRWLLTHGMELALVNCLHSPEYLSTLEAAVDVAAHNPSAEADYIFALQQLQSVNFSLLSKLKSNKDASIDTVMYILRLENPPAEKLGLTELQPYVDQLMVPIHHSPDKVVVGASALSLALDVSSIHIQKIRENIMNHRSALRDVFVPLAEPFSAVVLTGSEGTSNIMPTTADTTTTLSITLAFASTIAPISVNDYEVMGTDDQAGADGNAEPFLNVNDAKLNIPR
nr:hypothetical protein [Tanacetum cinerariifolium]